MSDHRQECLFEDLLEDFDDGSLCALSLRSDRNYDALSAIPTKEEFSALGVDTWSLSSVMSIEERLARLFLCCKDILMRLSFCGIRMTMIMFSLLPFLNLFHV